MKRTLFFISTIALATSFLAGCELSSDVDNNIAVLENTPQSVDTTESEMVAEVVYPHDEVIAMNIQITTDTYSELIENAADEEYYSCDITYNGYTLTNVAIRTKGNSSLNDVIKDDGNRFSYNIDLNYFEDQDLFGIDKLILNNIYKDPSMMAEYITYEALESLDATASRTTFVSLSINGEYYGLYLSVEHVGNEFLDTNFDNSDGELYKPDNGTGANLAYITDTTNYSALVNENSDDLTNGSVIELLERIDSGENIDELFNVDGYLKYLAISTFVVNLDSYQGGAYHNYYLYNNNGVYEWIAWDLNMSFNGFPRASLTDEEAVSFLIDEPTIGSTSNYPLISAILSNDEYLNTYHEYLKELTTNYFDTDTFTQRVTDIDLMINEYVKNDTNSFYSYDEYEKALFSTDTSLYSLVQFIDQRTPNVEQQLSGDISSTNNGEGNGLNTPTGPKR